MYETTETNQKGQKFVQFFSCNITLARMSSIVLNKSNENIYPPFFLDIREKAFTLLVLNRTSAIGIL